MKSVAEVVGVSRSNLIERMRERAKKRIGRPPLPHYKLVAEIKAVIAELPTYGYRRVHAILKRQALAAGLKPPNHKRVYRVMKVHGLLLDRHAGGVERRHDGRIAVDERNRRWCSDGFEIGCDNGERVRVAFALDCCDREAMSFLATTSGVSGENVRDLMLAAVEHRFGPVNRLPVTIEWLSDNGSCYLASETRSFARDIGLELVPGVKSVAYLRNSTNPVFAESESREVEAAARSFGVKLVFFNAKQAQQGGQRGPCRSQVEGAVCRPWCRGVSRFVLRLRQVHCHRNREVGQGDPFGEHQAGMKQHPGGDIP